jgi:hypothetical protein
MKPFISDDFVSMPTWETVLLVYDAAKRPVLTDYGATGPDLIPHNSDDTKNRVRHMIEMMDRSRKSALATADPFDKMIHLVSLGSLT